MTITKADGGYVEEIAADGSAVITLQDGTIWTEDTSGVKTRTSIDGTVVVE